MKVRAMVVLAVFGMRSQYIAQSYSFLAAAAAVVADEECVRSLSSAASFNCIRAFVDDDLAGGFNDKEMPDSAGYDFR